jgi:hypothetical protein
MTPPTQQDKPIDLEALRLAAEAATPGPWHSAESYADNGAFSGIDICSDDGTLLLGEDAGPGERDALFMALANPAAILALLSLIDAQQKQIAELTGAELSYELLQNDEWQAGTSGAGALQDIKHYAAQYSQDGPVQIFEVRRTEVKP